VAITGTASGITKILTDYHQIHPARATLYSNTSQRGRILSNWQRAVDKLVPLRNWHWRYEDSVITGDAEDPFVILPSAWGNEGRDGVFWDLTHQTPVGWIGLRDIRTMLERYPTERGAPRHYSVAFGGALLFPALAEETQFRVTYQRKKPTLQDTDGMTTEGYDNGGLEIIPSQWWETFLYEYAKMLEMPYVGSASEALVQKDLLEEMLFNLVMEETQGKTIPDYMPRFPGSASVWEVE
jgi:hypothetical protein